MWSGPPVRPFPSFRLTLVSAFCHRTGFNMCNSGGFMAIKSVECIPGLSDLFFNQRNRDKYAKHTTTYEATMAEPTSCVFDERPRQTQLASRVGPCGTNCSARNRARTCPLFNANRSDQAPQASFAQLKLNDTSEVV